MHPSVCAEVGFGFQIFRLLLIYSGLCSEAKDIELTLSRKSLFSSTQLVSEAEVSFVSNYRKKGPLYIWTF